MSIIESIILLLGEVTPKQLKYEIHLNRFTSTFDLVSLEELKRAGKCSMKKIEFKSG